MRRDRQGWDIRRTASGGEGLDGGGGGPRDVTIMCCREIFILGGKRHVRTVYAHLISPSRISLNV